MSETLGESSTNTEDAEKKKKASLEDKSKEELVQIIKKQLGLLQKAKSKSDELNKKCLVLEEQVEKQETNEKDFQNQIENLKEEIKRLSLLNTTFAREREQDIINLKEKIDVSQEKELVSFSSLNEKDERIECLSMQLDTVKKTCQCYQEELTKHLTTIEEMKEKIQILTTARDSAIESLKVQDIDTENKLKDYSYLLNESNELRKKYNICMEENCSLNSKITELKQCVSELQSDNKKLQVEKTTNRDNLESNAKKENVVSQSVENEELLFLIADNQNLVSELNRVSSENDGLKKKIECLESDKGNKLLEKSCKQQNSQPSEQITSIEQELVESQKFLCDIECENSKLKQKLENLEESYQVVQAKLEELKKNKKSQEEQFKICMKEKLNLENEIKKLSLFFKDACDFQGGYEFALLHGAESESLENLPFSKDLKVEVKDQIISNEPNKTHSLSFSCASDMNNFQIGGLECALLGGGSVSELFDNNDISEHTPFFGSLVDKVDSKKVCLNDTLENKVDVSALNDIILLRQKIEVYAQLLEKTQVEKESLKFKIEEYEKEKYTKNVVTIEAFTTTDSEVSQEDTAIENISKIKEFEELLQHSKMENSEMIAKISNLESKFSDSLKNCDTLQNDVNSFKLELKNSHEENERLVLKTKYLESSMNDIEQQNLILDAKLAKISEVHQKYDIELEMLVPYILGILKQIVNFSPSQIEYPYNFDSLKVLLNDFISIFDINCNKIKQLESHLENCENQKQEIEDKVSHIEELNKFLEEEVKALQDELENIKCDSNFYRKSYDSFGEVKCLSSPSELYSIEETNETDDRTTSLDNECVESLDNWENDTVAEVDTAELSELSKNLLLKNDYPSHVCITEVPECSITNYNTLKSEISGLKGSLNSNLDRIKALENEVMLKEEEILKLKNIIAELHRHMKESNNKTENYETVLKQMDNLKNKLKTDKCQLISDISSSKILPNQEWNDFVHHINASMFQINENFNLMLKRSDNLEKIIKQMKLYFQKLSNDFDMCISSIENSNKDISLAKQVPLLNKTILQQSSNFNVDSDCENENLNLACILHDVLKSFESSKEKLFNILCNHIIATDKSLSCLNEQLTFYNNKSSEKSDVAIEQTSNDSNHESALKNQLIEAETKLKKLKQISLKLKKELEDSKKQSNEISKEKEMVVKELLETQKRFENISSEHYHCMQNYQSLQTEYDKSQDENEVQKENLKRLQDDLSTTLLELNSLKEKISEKDNHLVKSKEMLESVISTKEEVEKRYLELESKLIIAETKNGEKIFKLKELEATIENHENNIKTILDENNNLKNQLAQVLKDESKTTLMDLEIADYERSVSELNSQLQAKEVEITDLKQKLSSELEKVESLHEEIKSTETLKETEAKRAANLKDVLEKTKTELILAKEQEVSLITNVSSLKLQLEILVQQEENCKLQLSESSAEIQQLKEVIKTSSENHQRIVRSLETKISSQKQEMLCSHKEIEAVKQEFENYKTRVHSVLRQQKSVTPAVTPTDIDLKEKLEVMVEKSKVQIKDLSEKLTALSLEHESLQEEYENLLHKHNNVMDEKTKKETEFLTKLEQINAEKNQLRLTQENLSSQHLLQNEMLVSTYKKQIKIMSDEHKRTVNELQKQLESADLEISRLQRDQQKTYGGTPASSVCPDNPIPFDILSQERQEGEGSECTDGASTPLRQMSLSTIPASGFMSFEKLLQSSIEPGTPTGFMQCHECERLLSEINVANKKMDHISEVLNDSESSNLRLSEQVRVLKEEVRRLERNKEREQHAENLEYLKNVFIKFSTLNPSAEKAMLIPVLTTMLKLSPSEQQQLKSVSGDEEADDASNSSWGSYLHRWSGLA